MIWRKLLVLVFVVGMMLVINFGEAMTQMATKGQWWSELDSTFRWSDLNLPVERAPSSFASLSLRRAFVLGLVPEGSSEATLIEPLLYRTVADNLAELFFPRLRGFTFLTEVKNELVPFGINLDSLEEVARGLPSGSFSVAAEDTMSLGVLNAFVHKALESPVILVPAFDWTVQDTTTAEVVLANNRRVVAAYRTTIASNTRFILVHATGANNFQAFFEPTFRFGTSYALGGLKTDGGIGDTGLIDLALLTVVPEDSGNLPIFGEDAVVADTVGRRDFPAWPHKTVWGIFSRFDANQDFLVSISDAVFAAMAVLHGRPLPLLRLGDVNRNGILDPDDALIIFEKAFPRSAAGMTSPMIASEASTKGVIRVSGKEEANGTVVISIGFEGEIDSAKRFAALVQFDSQVLTLENASFALPVISALSGWLLDSTGQGFRVLAYPESMRSGDLITITLKRIGTGDIRVSLKPLVHDNFLAFGEEVRVEYAGVTGIEEEESGLVPRSFELYQNYPNPFNPGTIIEFDLTKQAFVALTVWNILGQKIGTFAQGMRAAGRHSVSFDGKDLPSGLYFYRLEAGGVTETKKMTLIH